MCKIKQLDQVLVNKIAAGEVVERPANVVKELVENSIDAQATRVDIVIKDGGLELIQIKDDGIGMDREDAQLCFSTHATSKISLFQDLYNISSLGFRGEAIPSIAAISDFTLETSDGAEGTMVNYLYGKKQKVEELARPQGTTITVANLFNNVPARLKFVKSVNAEFAHILQFVERIALTKPEISFSLVHNDKEVFLSNGNGNLLEIIANMYGLNVARSMIAVDFGDEEFAISGYVSSLDVNRANRNNIITLVNNRVVRNKISINAIDEAYRQYLFEKRYPIAILNIEVDPYLVDVNVHPAKLEVKFSKEDKLKDIILTGVAKALHQKDITYQATNVDRKIEKPSLSPVANEQLQLDLDYQPKPSVIAQPQVEYPAPASEVEPPVTPQKEPEEVVKDIRIIAPDHEVKVEIKDRPIKKFLDVQGQVLGTYIVAQDETGMYLIDQHAAKERINYEYYLSQYENRNLDLTDMLVPLTFDLPKSDFVKIWDNKDKLAQLGIELEELSSQTLVIRAIPAWMKDVNAGIFIEEMFAKLVADQNIDIVKMQDHAIATLACKASLKANTFLTKEGMQGLVNDLMRCDNPYVCPHGRPVIIYYTEYELEKLFKRVI